MPRASALVTVWYMMSSALHQLQATVKARALHGALALPERLKRIIAGGPVVLDGQTLDLDTQVVLRLQKLSGEKGAETLPIPQGRVALATQSGMVAGKQPIGASLDTSAGGVPVRVLTPRALVGQTGPLPTLIFIHGGGFIYGAGHDTHDGVGRFFAEQAGVQVISIDYRLAPEAPFPAAHDDCLAVYRGIVEDPAVLSVDTSRLAVGGDSAGGNLAAYVALAAAEAGLPLTYQMLIYPVTEAGGGSESRALFSDGFFLTKEFLDLAEASYLPEPGDAKDPRVDIINAAIPEGVCPGHVVTAGFDPLRDEGEAYARRLIDAGVALTMERRPGLIHGFANWVGVDSASRDAMLDVARRLRDALTS